MPFAYAGHCYATNGEALEAFQVSFPQLGDTTWIWHRASSIDAVGAITYTVVTKGSTSNATSNRSGTLQLATCTDVDYSAFDPTAAAALWTAMFSITMTLWVIAKKSGMILAFFKKQ